MQSGGSGGPRISRTSQTSAPPGIGGPRRQSGAPAPGSQPPYDPNQSGCLISLAGTTDDATGRPVNDKTLRASSPGWPATDAGHRRQNRARPVNRIALVPQRAPVPPR